MIYFERGRFSIKDTRRDSWKILILKEVKWWNIPYASHNVSLQNMPKRIPLEGLLSWVLSLIFDYWKVSSAEFLWLVESSQTIDQMASSSIRYYCHEVEQITRSTSHILLRRSNRMYLNISKQHKNDNRRMK